MYGLLLHFYMYPMSEECCMSLRGIMLIYIAGVSLRERLGALSKQERGEGGIPIVFHKIVSIYEGRRGELARFHPYPNLEGKLSMMWQEETT